ncbi:hypothetical protein DPMN_076705 [Dreissena polymorpha]|uniref:Uncharacterized protein n=1 Tax=Dreissena polymorpha TaxID=45954 RepID=A0A9D3YJI3_DREPO|nr:hypothetical protein DPMN_076705 [Dreissena polymorpha]
MDTVTEKLSLPLLWKRIRNESRFKCPLGPGTAHSRDRVRDMQPQGHNTGSSPRTSQNTQRGKNTMCAKSPINIEVRCIGTMGKSTNDVYTVVLPVCDLFVIYP